MDIHKQASGEELSLPSDTDPHHYIGGQNQFYRESPIPPNVMRNFTYTKPFNTHSDFTQLRDMAREVMDIDFDGDYTDWPDAEPVWNLMRSMQDQGHDSTEINEAVINEFDNLGFYDPNNHPKGDSYSNPAAMIMDYGIPMLPSEVSWHTNVFQDYVPNRIHDPEGDEQQNYDTRQMIYDAYQKKLAANPNYEIPERYQQPPTPPQPKLQEKNPKIIDQFINFIKDYTFSEKHSGKVSPRFTTDTGPTRRDQQARAAALVDSERHQWPWQKPTGKVIDNTNPDAISVHGEEATFTRPPQEHFDDVRRTNPDYADLVGLGTGSGQFTPSGNNMGDHLPPPRIGIRQAHWNAMEPHEQAWASQAHQSGMSGPNILEGLERFRSKPAGTNVKQLLNFMKASASGFEDEEQLKRSLKYLLEFFEVYIDPDSSPSEWDMNDWAMALNQLNENGYLKTWNLPDEGITPDDIEPLVESEWEKLGQYFDEVYPERFDPSTPYGPHILDSEEGAKILWQKPDEWKIPQTDDDIPEEHKNKAMYIDPDDDSTRPPGWERRKTDAIDDWMQSQLPVLPDHTHIGDKLQGQKDLWEAKQRRLEDAHKWYILPHDTRQEKLQYEAKKKQAFGDRIFYDKTQGIPNRFDADQINFPPNWMVGEASDDSEMAPGERYYHPDVRNMQKAGGIELLPFDMSEKDYQWLTRHFIQYFHPGHRPMYTREFSGGHYNVPNAMRYEPTHENYEDEFNHAMPYLWNLWVQMYGPSYAKGEEYYGEIFTNDQGGEETFQAGNDDLKSDIARSIPEYHDNQQFNEIYKVPSRRIHGETSGVSRGQLDYSEGAQWHRQYHNIPNKTGTTVHFQKPKDFNLNEAIDRLRVQQKLEPLSNDYDLNEILHHITEFNTPINYGRNTNKYVPPMQTDGTHPFLEQLRNAGVNYPPSWDLDEGVLRTGTDVDEADERPDEQTGRHYTVGAHYDQLAELLAPAEYRGSLFSWSPVGFMYPYDIRGNANQDHITGLDPMGGRNTIYSSGPYEGHSEHAGDSWDTSPLGFGLLLPGESESEILDDPVRSQHLPRVTLSSTDGRRKLGPMSLQDALLNIRNNPQHTADTRQTRWSATGGKHEGHHFNGNRGMWLGPHRPRSLPAPSHSTNYSNTHLYDATTPYPHPVDSSLRGYQESYKKHPPLREARELTEFLIAQAEEAGDKEEANRIRFTSGTWTQFPYHFLTDPEMPLWDSVTSGPDDAVKEQSLRGREWRRLEPLEDTLWSMETGEVYHHLPRLHSWLRSSHRSKNKELQGPVEQHRGLSNSVLHDMHSPYIRGYTASPSYELRDALSLHEMYGSLNTAPPEGHNTPFISNSDPRYRYWADHYGLTHTGIPEPDHTRLDQDQLAENGFIYHDGYPIRRGNMPVRGDEKRPRLTPTAKELGLWTPNNPNFDPNPYTFNPTQSAQLKNLREQYGRGGMDELNLLIKMLEDDAPEGDEETWMEYAELEKAYPANLDTLESTKPGELKKKKYIETDKNPGQLYGAVSKFLKAMENQQFSPQGAGNYSMSTKRGAKAPTRMSDKFHHRRRNRFGLGHLGHSSRLGEKKELRHLGYSPQQSKRQSIAGKKFTRHGGGVHGSPEAFQ